MKEYIEREAALAAIKNLYQGIPFTKAMRQRWHDNNRAYMQCERAVESIPAADVVEVVRCKDCKWYQLDVWGDKIQCEKIYDVADGDLDGFNFRPSPDHFCAYGKRKEVNADDER